MRENALLLFHFLFSTLGDQINLDFEFESSLPSPPSKTRKISLSSWSRIHLSVRWNFNSDERCPFAECGGSKITSEKSIPACYRERKKLELTGMMIFEPTYFSAHWEWVITRVKAFMNIGQRSDMRTYLHTNRLELSSLRCKTFMT